MEYIETPAKQYNITRKGGKDTKMSKKQEIPTAKTRKSYQKTRAEHYKDIVIAVLVTGIIAFIAGTQFNASQNNAISKAVEAVTPQASATELK